MIKMTVSLEETENGTLRHTQARKHLKMEAETGVSLPQPQRQELQEEEWGGKVFLLEPSEGSWPADISIASFWVSEL